MGLSYCSLRRPGERGPITRACPRFGASARGPPCALPETPGVMGPRRPCASAHLGRDDEREVSATSSAPLPAPRNVCRPSSCGPAAPRDWITDGIGIDAGFLPPRLADVEHHAGLLLIGAAAAMLTVISGIVPVNPFALFWVGYVTRPRTRSSCLRSGHLPASRRMRAYCPNGSRRARAPPQHEAMFHFTSWRAALGAPPRQFVCENGVLHSFLALPCTHHDP